MNTNRYHEIKNPSQGSNGLLNKNCLRQTTNKGGLADVSIIK